MSSDNIFGNMLVSFFILCLSLTFFMVFIWSVIWAYKDGNERGKPGWLVALMVFFVSWPAGLFIWLVFRPEKTNTATHAGKIIEDDKYPDPEDLK